MHGQSRSPSLHRPAQRTNERGLSPVLGTVLLVGIVGALAATMAVVIPAAGDLSTDQQRAVLDLTVDPDTNTVTIIHEGGDPIDFASVEVMIYVDGEPLEHQPPTPYFSASGFAPGPTGAINKASEDTVTVAEQTSFQIADTNDPLPEPGSTVRVDLIDDGATMVRLETTA